MYGKHYYKLFKCALFIFCALIFVKELQNIHKEPILKSAEEIKWKSLKTDTMLQTSSITHLPILDKQNNNPDLTVAEYWNRTNPSRPDLIIARFGRMGNQMFHYAVAYCAALQTYRTPTIHKDSFIFNLFPYLSAKKINFTIRLNESHHMNMSLKVGDNHKWSGFNKNWINDLKKSNNTWLAGTFQSWKYFVGCEKAIRSEFKFNPITQAHVNTVIKNHAKTYMFDQNILFYDITFIGIHVRRGDLVIKQNLLDLGYTSAPASYIENAMNYFSNKYRYPLFIVVSDDIPWCKSNIHWTGSRKKVYFSDGRLPLNDLVLLASCNHSVITVGSYSWFSGWLAGGEVVYYRGFPAEKSSLFRGVNFADRYPPSWIPMY